MNIIARETSEFSGQPIELYEFSFQSQILRYTSSDGDSGDQNDITIGGNIYIAVPIQRDEVEQSQELGRSQVAISVPNSLDFIQQYIAAPPAGKVAVKILRFHAGDSELGVVWLGAVLNVEFGDGEIATITCEPILSSIRRPLLRRLYQRSCPHILYGAQCRAVQPTFTDNGVVIDIVNNITIRVAGLSGRLDGYHTGGIFSVTINSIVTRRYIQSHIGVILVINLPITALRVGNVVELSAGCDHSIETCTNKFSNELNYGGTPFIPEKNIFNNTSPVF